MYTLITGASSGIGLELAKCAAKSGHALILVARNKESLRAVADSLETKVQIITCDLSRPGSAQEIFETIRQHGWHVDQLINNAGVGDYGPFIKSDLSRQLSMIQLNITSLVELTHLLLPQIVDLQGRIMNVGSVASFFPGPMMSVYFATKSFVLSFSQALHEELKTSNVSVTCLCPGPTATKFGSSAHVSETHSTFNPRTTAASVARIGWRAMQRGDAMVINSIPLRISVFIATRLLPRGGVNRLIMKIQR